MAEKKTVEWGYKSKIDGKMSVVNSHYANEAYMSDPEYARDQGADGIAYRRTKTVTTSDWEPSLAPGQSEPVREVLATVEIDGQERRVAFAYDPERKSITNTEPIAVSPGSRLEITSINLFTRQE